MYSGLKRLLTYKMLHQYGTENLRSHPQIAVFAFDHIAHNINVYGRYENSELLFLNKYLFPKTERGVCLDIGANIGNHSLYFAKEFSSVLSFEPNPRTFKLLEVNACISDNIRCFPFGASKTNTFLTAVDNQLNVGTSRVVRDHHAPIGGEKSLEFKVRNLDEFLKDAGVKKVDFVKIDVEGHELQAIEGLRKTLARDYPPIAFESNMRDNEEAQNNILDLLKEIGYTKFFEMKGAHRIDKYPKWAKKYLVRLIYLLGRDINYSYFPVEIFELERKNYPLIIASIQDISE